VDAAARKRIAEYVKPLAVGLDGITYSGDVDRVIAASEKIALEERGRKNLDPDLIYLLAVFSGQEKWVERMGHASRTEIFLSSLGVPAKTIRAVFRGLSRLVNAPSTPEEEIVHDAILLDEMGAYGIARHLREGYRERQDFAEMAETIEQAAAKPLATAAGEELAVNRRKTMLDFARRLREEYDEFGDR
jgi:hypothetical protein